MTLDLTMDSKCFVNLAVFFLSKTVAAKSKCIHNSYYYTSKGQYPWFRAHSFLLSELLKGDIQKCVHNLAEDYDPAV